MKTQTKIFAALRDPDPTAQRRCSATAAVAIIIGLTFSACTSKGQEGNAASLPRMAATSAPALAVQAAPEAADRIDNSRECNIEQTILDACIFV